MLSLLTVLVAFGTNLAATALSLRWLADKRFVAVENHRTMHQGSVPTGGGLPLLATAFVTAIAFWQVAPLAWVAVAIACALAIVSWADDVSSLPPALRFLVHASAATALMLWLPADARIAGGLIPLAVERIALGVALVWFLNLYNFMDGIDGIAGVETLTLVVGYAAISGTAIGTAGPLYPIALAIAGATVAFLVFNWAPARIFMGDVGAVPLGFVTGAMMIDLATRYSLAAALILPLYFVADATWTLLTRLVCGKRPWEAHRDHLYQRAARASGSHAAVVRKVAAANAMLLMAAVLAVTALPLGIALAAASLAWLWWTLSRMAAARAFSDEVAAGSSQENATDQEPRASDPIPSDRKTL